MIKNQRQYEITKRWRRDFKAALEEVREKDDPLLVQLEAAAINSQIKEPKATDTLRSNQTINYNDTDFRCRMEARITTN